MIKQSDTIVFTIGINYYDKLYDRCIKSQRAYAQRMGYDYHIVTGSAWLPDDAAWLKIKMISHFLEGGYRWVLFVDADVQIQERTPRVQELSEQHPDHSVFVSVGKSGNINSGVFVVKNEAESVKFFEDLYDRTMQPVPEGINAPRENARVIALAREYDCVCIVDQRRNNSVDPELDDYCRHYVWASPLGAYYHKDAQERAITWYLKQRRWTVLRLHKLCTRMGWSLYHPHSTHRVERLYRIAVSNLKKLSNASQKKI